ncbi:MAG: TonB-dependent receptor [Bacteroidales bacterium]|nr:TonB-dependent receptor [Bacteroidales bacterium]
MNINNLIYKSVFLLMSSSPLFASAQIFNNDSIPDVELSEVRILSSRVPLSRAQTPILVRVISRDEILSAPSANIEQILKTASGVDVRQRGDGVQTDISLRGGTFDQITILLNGINISSPHTGHLSADFPVSVDDIERIEILEGPSARVFGTQSFCGTINIVTVDADPSKNGYTFASQGVVNTFAGDNGHYGANISTAFSHNAGYNAKGNPNRFVHNFSAGYISDDGDVPNSSYSVSRIFYRGGYRSDNVKADFQAGYSYKPFDANTFYGAASTDQWESNEHFLLSANAEITSGNFHFNPVVSLDRRYDHYQWHKNSHTGENFHRCDVSTIGFNAWTKSSIGRSSIGVEMRSEQIFSTKLGNPLDSAKFFATRGIDAENGINYSHSADRTNITVILEHDFLFNRWTVALAAPAVYNSMLDYQWRWCPGADVSFRPNIFWKLYANVNTAMRMPTFTDLYYSGTNIIGTQDLDPERTVDYSLGVRRRNELIDAGVTLFGSHKTDMIDWVIYADEPDGQTYRSGNFEMETMGGEADFSIRPRAVWNSSFITKIGAQYSYIDANIEHTKPIAASKYAQEYLRHKVTADIELNPVNNLTICTEYRYQYRVGEGNEPYSLVDMSANYTFKKLTLYVQVYNLLNKEYFDFSYIEQPGRRFTAGLKYKF